MFYMFSTSLWGRLRYLCIFFGDQVWSKELILQRLTLPVHCKEASERGNVVWCDWWDLVRFWKSDVLRIHLFFEVFEVYRSFASFIYSLMSSVMISDNFSTHSTLPKPDHHTSGQEVANARLVTLSQRNATISSEREHVERVCQHIRLQNSLVHVSYRTSFERLWGAIASFDLQDHWRYDDGITVFCFRKDCIMTMSLNLLRLFRSVQRDIRLSNRLGHTLRRRSLGEVYQRADWFVKWSLTDLACLGCKTSSRESVSSNVPSALRAFVVPCCFCSNISDQV